MKALLLLASLLTLSACSTLPPPRAADVQAAQEAVRQLAPVFVKKPVDTLPAPFALDPLKCAVVVTQALGRQIIKLEANNPNCPAQDTGRAIYVQLSKDGRLLITYGLWADHGSQASTALGVTISREDGGPIR